MEPLKILKSVPQIPLWVTRTSTSPDVAPGRATSSRTSVPGAVSTMALMRRRQKTLRVDWVVAGGVVR